MRLRVADAAEANGLAQALAQQGTVILEQVDAIVSLLWPAMEADDPDEWDEQTFVELVFFLRVWSGTNPRRALVLLEEGPVEIASAGLRRAS